MKTVGNVLLAVLILLAMITVHEFGHYIVGKLLKFKINEFAIGMGPALFKRKSKNGEIFSVRLFPLGGYCAFEGEDEENPSENAFNNKKPWQRILVLLAGATMNYLLALAVIFMSFGIYGQALIGVKYVAYDPVYAEQSLQNGDSILSVTVGGKKTNVYLTTDLINALNGRKAGDEASVEVLRGGKAEKVTVKLRKDVNCGSMTESDKVFDALGFGSAFMLETNGKTFENGDYLLKAANGDKYEDGIFINTEADLLSALADKTSGEEVGFWLSRKGERIKVTSVLSDEWTAVDKTDFSAVCAYFGITSAGNRAFYTMTSYRKVGFFRTIARGFEYSAKIGGTIFRSLGELLTGKIGIRSVGGTITTIATASKLVGMGFVYALEITAFIGVNLAVFNLLPIPALDGSRIVFCIIEWIRKKPVNRKIEAIVHAVGFVLILGFAVLVDVLHLFA